MAVAQAEVFMSGAPLALPGSVSRRSSKGAVGLSWCILAIRDLSRADTGDDERAGASSSVDRVCWRFVRFHGTQFASLTLAEAGLVDRGAD